MSNERAILPSLASLRSFEAAARHQSFTNAAAELNVSQGAVSRQVKELEQTLGLSLFRRVGRAVRLTHAGRALARDLRRDLKGLSNTISRARLAANDAVAIRLAVLPTFGDRWLLPRLKQFLLQHPRIRLSIATRLQPFDLEAEGFDMAIHFGRPDWPDATLTLLCDETMLAVAAPGFIAEHALEDRQNMPRAPRLSLASRPRAWGQWFEQCGLADGHRAPLIEFDQFNLIITAACQGMGMALLPQYLIEPELESGALVALAASSLKTANSYYIARPRGDDSEATSTLCDWLLQCVARK